MGDCRNPVKVDPAYSERPAASSALARHAWSGLMGDPVREGNGWDMEQGVDRRVNGYGIQLVQHNASVDVGGQVGIVRDKDDRPGFFLTA